ncbi:MAG: IS66 family transposase, partial [Bifidobacteriaceae bacterium]|nr:IS66 family transposase [Bifidobacteriaceae bacterium]
DPRMAKLRMKVSGGLRTAEGANQFARLRSYLSTAAKNGVHGFDALTRVFTRQPYLPQTT